MKAFFDTNVLVAAVGTDEQRLTTAVRLSNEIDEGYTSILNVMELRSVLARKKAFERDRIDRIEDRIARKTTVTFPDASDIVAANQLRSETLLYSMDTLILTSAESIRFTSVCIPGLRTTSDPSSPWNRNDSSHGAR